MRRELGPPRPARAKAGAGNKEASLPAAPGGDRAGRVAAHSGPALRNGLRDTAGLSLP